MMMQSQLTLAAFNAPVFSTHSKVNILSFSHQRKETNLGLTYHIRDQSTKLPNRATRIKSGNWSSKLVNLKNIAKITRTNMRAFSKKLKTSSVRE